MAVYNNRYYPDELAVSWGDLAGSGSNLYVEADYVVTDYVSDSTGLGWGDGVANWHTWTNSAVSWSYITSSLDLGSVRTGYPVSSAEWDRGDPAAPTTCLISYQTSNDNSTFSNASAGTLTGRYIKTVVTTTGSYISRIETTMNFDTVQQAWTGVNTAVLAGTVSGRTLDKDIVGNIAYVSAENSVGTYSRSSYDIDVLSETADDFTFVVKDLDTWGRANVDAVLDIVAQGYPRVAANAALGRVDRVIA